MSSMETFLFLLIKCINILENHTLCLRFRCLKRPLRLFRSSSKLEARGRKRRTSLKYHTNVPECEIHNVRGDERPQTFTHAVTFLNQQHLLCANLKNVAPHPSRGPKCDGELHVSRLTDSNCSHVIVFLSLNQQLQFFFLQKLCKSIKRVLQKSYSRRLSVIRRPQIKPPASLLLTHFPICAALSFPHHRRTSRGDDCKTHICIREQIV